MTNQDAKVALDHFKSITWTNDSGVKMTSVQINSQLSKLQEKERQLRKNAEAAQKNADQALEIERLRGLLASKEGRSATKTS